MQSAAAVPCTSSSNGIKRTAANASFSDQQASSATQSLDQNNANSSSTASDSPPPPNKRQFIVVESPLKLETIASSVSFFSSSFHLKYPNSFFLTVADMDKFCLGFNTPLSAEALKKQFYL